MKSYTDISQSKKLADILPLESADMSFNISQRHNMPPLMTPYSRFKEFFNMEPTPAFLIPCWSLAALLDVLPNEISTGEGYQNKYEIDIRRHYGGNNITLYQIVYGNYHWYEDGSCSWSDMVNSGEKEDLLDAVFQMICWLKENNKL